MSFGGFSQCLELVDFFLKRRDGFLQIGFALREGLDLARFNLAFQVHGTELGDFTIEYTNLFARLPIQGPVGRGSPPWWRQEQCRYHSQQGHPDYSFGAYIGRSFPATIAQTWPGPTEPPRICNQWKALRFDDHSRSACGLRAPTAGRRARSPARQGVSWSIVPTTSVRRWGKTLVAANPRRGICDRSGMQCVGPSS